MNIQKVIEDYIIQDKHENSFEKFGEYYEITTSYLDSANDCLQIYVRQNGDEIYFTDDGASLQNLEMVGYQLAQDKKDRLQKILRQYGVQINGDELTATSSAQGFSEQIHLFAQAMLAVDEIMRLTQNTFAGIIENDE